MDPLLDLFQFVELWHKAEAGAEERHAQRREHEGADASGALLDVVDRKLEHRLRGPIGQTGFPVRASWMIIPMMPIIAARPLLRPRSA